MTPSEPVTAEARVRELERLLSEMHLRGHIDEPIDAAAASFRRPAAPGDVNALLAAFVCHVFAHGLRLPRGLDAAAGLAEAVFLLDRGYRDVHSEGYDGAVLDARLGGPAAVQEVLNRLAAIIKASERAAYLQWVLAQRLECLDWRTKCQMAEVVRRRMLAAFGDQGEQGPATQILRRPAERLAPSLKELLLVQAGAAAQADAMLEGA